jgi:hypothetical protein
MEGSFKKGDQLIFAVSNERFNSLERASFHLKRNQLRL